MVDAAESDAKKRDGDEESEPTRRSLFSLPMENNSFFPGALMNII